MQKVKEKCLIFFMWQSIEFQDRHTSSQHYLVKRENTMTQYPLEMLSKLLNGKNLLFSCFYIKTVLVNDL